MGQQPTSVKTESVCILTIGQVISGEGMLILPDCFCFKPSSCFIFLLCPVLNFFNSLRHIFRFASTFTVIFFMYIPLLLIIVLNVWIFIVLKKQAKNEPGKLRIWWLCIERSAKNNVTLSERHMYKIFFLPDRNSKSSSNLNEASRNVLKTMILLSTAFCLCTMPSANWYLLYELNVKGASLDSAFYHITVIAVLCNCGINPFLYTFKYREFQESAKRLLCQCKNQDQTGQQRSNVNQDQSSPSTLSTIA